MKKVFVQGLFLLLELFIRELQKRPVPKKRRIRLFKGKNK